MSTPDQSGQPGPVTEDGRLPISSAKSAAALLWVHLRRHRLAGAVCLSMFLLQALAGLVAPWMLGRIVDATTGGAVDRDAVVSAVVWIAVAAVIGGVACTLAIAFLARLAEPTLAALREQALDRAVHLEQHHLDEVGAGDVLSRVGDDVRVVAESFTEVVPLVLNSALTVLLTVGGLAALDWRLGLAGLLAAPFYVGGLRWYLPRSAPYYRQERAAYGERAEALLSGVHASATLRAHGLAERQQHQIEQTSWRAVVIGLDVFRLLTRFFGRTNRAELIGLLAILVTGFWLVRSESVTVGAVTAAALYFHRLFNPIGALLTVFDELQSAGASLTRIAGLALLPTIAVEAERSRAAAAPGGLELRGLHHEYLPGRVALAHLDLSLAPGERVAVVGRSGAGKSTLGLAAAGRLRPSQGVVLLDGVELTRTPPASVALVTQEVHVFTGTVRDNLTLAAPDADDAELEAALRRTGAWPAVRALPEGLDTAVGDQARDLTPDLAQHLALTRVVLADPSVVVLDEATAEAGSAGARGLERAADAVVKGRTALVVAHRLGQAAVADRVVVMESGAITETGSHEELVAAGGYYAELWSAWSTSGD